MKLEQLVKEIRRKRSFLCVGLDSDLSRIPEHLQIEDDPVFAFNKAIIDATHEYCVAYKPNLAFYEAQGVNGWRSLEHTMAYLNHYHPEIFTIADAKRGDIGNTAKQYGRAFFESMGFNAVTVAPYMGRDSVEPFLSYPDKFVILLALTSNPGAADFQTETVGTGTLFERVIEVSQQYENSERLMYVVGATQADQLKKIRDRIPHSFLLIPGVGTQGGDLKAVCESGLNEKIGLLVNSSRAIIYASSGKDFAEIAGAKAQAYQQQMAAYIPED